MDLRLQGERWQAYLTEYAEGGPLARMIRCPAAAGAADGSDASDDVWTA